MYPALNLPPAELKIREGLSGLEVWDIVRRRYVFLTPEEWVRQHLVNYFINDLGYPKTMFRVERQVKFRARTGRSDVVIYKGLDPYILVEVKSANVAIDKSVLEQAAQYNLTLKAPILMVSNGLVHWAAQRLENGTYQALDSIPAYNQISD